jgi:aminoacylase
MKLNNQRPNRTIHVSYVPDEEIGGLTGFYPFIQTKEFKDLNVGLALDEGNLHKKWQKIFWYFLNFFKTI